MKMLYLAYFSRKRSNWMPNVSAVVSTTLGISCIPGSVRRIPLRPTTSSSAKASMSLCMPGVLTDGGPRGRDDERAWRLRPSLRGSSGPSSDRIIWSPMDDMSAVWVGTVEEVLVGYEEGCEGEEREFLRVALAGRVKWREPSDLEKQGYTPYWLMRYSFAPIRQSPCIRIVSDHSPHQQRRTTSTPLSQPLESSPIPPSLNHSSTIPCQDEHNHDCHGDTALLHREHPPSFPRNQHPARDSDPCCPGPRPRGVR